MQLGQIPVTAFCNLGLIVVYIALPVFHVATQKVSQHVIVWAENGQMAENVIHQRALVGCALCTEEAEGGGWSEWDDRL